MGFSKAGARDDQVETVQLAEKPKRGGCVGFMKKWWWALLIVGAIVILVVMLLIFFVAIPKIIQKKVDDSVLTIEGISVMDTRTDTLTISINSTITSSDSIHANIDGFTAEMYLEDKLPHTPFVTLEMPETHTGVATVNISQGIDTASSQEYIDFNAWYMLNETLRVTVKGETHVRVKGLKATKVNFEQTVTLTGLNGFEGLNVTSVNITTLYDSRGDNFHGFVDIPNPSVLSLDIGNATFANLLNGTKIGDLYIDNMFIYPGINNLSIRANISQPPVIAALTTLPYCTDGIVPFQLLGESVINNNQSLPYFADALASHAQETEIDVGSALAITLGAQLSCKKPKST